MKKKALIVGAVFVLFLIVGLWYNLTPGRYFSDDFWRLKGDTYSAWTGDSVRVNEDGTFALRFADKDMTASLSETEDGLRVDFSDGWAVEEAAISSDFWVEVGGVVLTGETEYILTDMEKANLRFERAAEEIREPFYDENGKEIGESVYILLETGEAAGWREVWYEQPEFSTPEQETMVVREGARLKHEDFRQSLLVNEEGEYLANTDSAAYVEMSGGVWRDRGSVAAMLIRMAKDEPGRRGEVAAVFLYALIYLLCAANFLWPEQLAFFGSRWQYRNEPELSDEGLFVMQLGSVIGMIMGIIVLFILP